MKSILIIFQTSLISVGIFFLYIGIFNLLENQLQAVTFGSMLILVSASINRFVKFFKKSWIIFSFGSLLFGLGFWAAMMWLILEFDGGIINLIAFILASILFLFPGLSLVLKAIRDNGDANDDKIQV